jgi:hypothetical protein
MTYALYFSREILKERDYFGDVSVDGRIILIWS